MKFNSKLIHAGWDSDADAEGAITVPIYRTTAYQFNNTEHAASLFALKEFGKIYSRIGNPTVGALCLLYTSPSPRDQLTSRMPSSA